MATLWHCPGARSFRCLWTLHELGRQDDVELITMPFPPRMNVPGYLKANVLGTIPCFEDPGRSIHMTESVAISLYLAQSTPLVLEPSHPEYGAFLNWCIYSEATITFPQTVVLRYTIQEPGVADGAVKGYSRWFIARLRRLNEALADGREFLCAGRFTVADICVGWALWMGTTLSGLDGNPLSDRYKPHVKAWMERILSRPSRLAAIEHESESADAFDEEAVEAAVAAAAAAAAAAAPKAKGAAKL
eukprot:g516.t1